MSAIKRAKIYARQRTPLEKVIPLEAPFSVQIDICSACNLQCNFCFHSDKAAIDAANIKFGVMQWETYQKIIDDMKTSWGEQKIKKLRLFKIGEPLLNRNVCQMVKYAKEANVAECIEITTNGTLLNKEMSLDLIEAGLDILNISVNGINEQQYTDACKCKIDFEEFRRNIAFFYQNRKKCKLYLKYSDIGYSNEEKEIFYSEFGEICDEMFVETISSTLWQETNINEHICDLGKGTYGQELKQKQVCPFLFTTMVINDRGIAHLCCVDWKSAYVLGDLNKEHIADIWNGEKLREYQKQHLMMKKDEIIICRNCESLSANTVDNIDLYAEEILQRLGESGL